MVGAEFLARTLAGAGPAPLLEAGRCASERVRRPICSACKDACPRAAIALSPGPRIDDTCDGCGLCAAACPQEALGPTGSTAGAAGSPGARGDLVRFRCAWGAQDAAGAHELVPPCLGTLRVEDLVEPFAYGARAVELDWRPCGACEKGPFLGHLRSAIEVALGLLGGGRPLRLLDDVTDSVERSSSFGAPLEPPRGRLGKTVSRRGLFELLLGNVRSGLSDRGGTETPKARTKPDEESTTLAPGRRRLLEALGRLAATEQARRARAEGFVPAGESQKVSAFWSLQAGPACDGCVTCASLCPTGALKRSSEAARVTLSFGSAACTGCGVCVSACAPGALKLSPAAGPQEPPPNGEVRLAQVEVADCDACGLPFAAGQRDARRCPACRWRPGTWAQCP